MSWWKQFFRQEQSSSPVDYDRLGRELADLLWASLKTGPAADALKQLARECQPSADEGTIALEVILFHQFLLVQACAGGITEGETPDSITRQAVSAFYVAFYREVQSRSELEKSTLDVLRGLWAVRANEYEEPFHEDFQEFLRKEGKGAFQLPWKRVVAKFVRHFVEIPDPMELTGSVKACFSVAGTFGGLFTSVGETIRAHYGQHSK